MSFVLAFAVLVSLMTTPASAAIHKCNANGQATVTMKGQVGETYSSYRTRSDAEYHQLTLYVKESDFPIKVEVVPYGGFTPSAHEITSYGIHLVTWTNNWWSIEGSYFAVVIKQPSEAPKNTVQPTQEKILEQKTKTLIRALDLPCYYSTIDTCVYTREVKAFLSGEWDGSQRSDDNTDTYSAIRYVERRTYYWIGSNLCNGKSYNLKANVDYTGYMEVIPAPTNAQDYSLAVSRVNGEIEKWSLFNQQDVWKIEQVANGSERIQNIIPLGTATSKEDDCQVFVDTIDFNGQQHMYSLTIGGKVFRMV